MSLIITDVVFPPQEWKHLYNKERVERLGHPMRDIMLQAVGVQCAEYLNATGRGPINTVMLGQTANEVMPHASVDALRLASFYTQLDRDDESWAIRSPFLWRESMTKGDVIRWGLEHDVPLAITWSCFYSGETPCGECQECVRRAEAMKIATETFKQ
ncbi:7-cyano-7-deazaguanine synthase [subsurface metagenome]